MAVKPAALILEPPDEPIEFGRELEVWRATRALHGARAGDEDFEVADATEQILCVLQPTEAGGRA